MHCPSFLTSLSCTVVRPPAQLIPRRFSSCRAGPDKESRLSVSCRFPRMVRDRNALSAEIVQLLRIPPPHPPPLFFFQGKFINLPHVLLSLSLSRYLCLPLSISLRELMAWMFFSFFFFFFLPLTGEMFISARKHVWVPRTYSLAAAGWAALTVLIAQTTAICTHRRSLAPTKYIYIYISTSLRLLSFLVCGDLSWECCWWRTCDDATLVWHSAIREIPQDLVGPRDKCPPRRSPSLRAFTVQKHTARLLGYGNMCSLLCWRRQQRVSHWSCLSVSVATQRVLTLFWRRLRGPVRKTMNLSLYHYCHFQRWIITDHNVIEVTQAVFMHSVPWMMCDRKKKLLFFCY